MPVEFDAEDRWQTAPLSKTNWTLRASLRARDQVKAALKNGPLESLFYHTQVTAMFSHRIMKRIPSVVSLDATPVNVDSVGAAYNHAPSGNRQVEALKNALNRRSFQSAAKIITWCDWAKRSLVKDYSVDAEKITVIPPGIDMAKWKFERNPTSGRGPVRLLFVGGDFKRKGGAVLLEAYKRELMKTCELDIVTREEVNTEGLTGVRVHHGLNSNAPELMALYAKADAFVFPTLGDCLPIAVMEAMASGLPVISTCVGAIDEEVEHGVTGFLTHPNDHNAIAEAVIQLIDNPDLRQSMGQAGRLAAESKFDGARNYRRVIDICKGLANAG